MKQLIKTSLLVLPALLLYAYFCQDLNITQDDAYISYRYVANYLDGHGLVYNIGERVEGFTNFGWVVYLLFWGALKVSYITLSKVTGYLFGAGVIVVTMMVSRFLFSDRDSVYGWLAVYLVGINQSLAYWSPAGLETAAFSFFAFLSLYLYLKRSRLLIWTLTIAVLLRPEGALVAFIVVVVELLETRKMPLFSLRCVAWAFAFSVPMVIFKLGYYGSLLPNPFYAKTGLSMDRFSDGLEYVGRFMSHYGFFGAGLAVPMVLYRRLSHKMRSVLVFMVLYCVYVVAVGGDVLKVHRFFIPLIGINALLISISLWLLTWSLRHRGRTIVLTMVAISLAAGTFFLPRHFVLTYNRLERNLVAKMSFVADRMIESDRSEFSVAASTIGVFGYRLIGHQLIDMLGLTDSTIARYPEPVTDNLASTWKERKYNAAYVLSRQPDYIMFSTGIKPSAPAEKALLMYRPFLDNYRTIGWASQGSDLRSGTIFQVFKRFKPIESELEATYPLEFVEFYKQGLEAHIEGNQRQAIAYYDRALEVSPQPAYVYLYAQKGLSYGLMNDHGRAMALMDSAIAMDSNLFMTHARLYQYTMRTRDLEKAAIHRRWLSQLTPWYLPRVEAQILESLKKRPPGQR